MIWQTYAKTLTDLLKLERKPVGVTFTYEDVSEIPAPSCRPCTAWLEAAQGKTLRLAAENTNCPGGKIYLGFSPYPTGKQYLALKKFLIEGEKLCENLAVWQRFRSYGVDLPHDLADNVVFAPLETARLKPQLVVFLANPEQISRLMALSIYGDGLPPRLHMIGSACQQVIAYPLVKGELNVSLMDPTVRHLYKPEEMALTVPYHKMAGIVENIPHSTSGTAKMERPGWDSGA